MKFIPVIFTVLVTLISCNLFGPEKTQENEGVDAVRIEYLGSSTSGNTDLATFKLVNDSTSSIQYFAYDITSLHYSTEVLTDTGWVYLFWNWCGTGAEYFELEAGSSVEFQTFLPDSSCTWRVLTSISDMTGSNGYILRSESLNTPVIKHY